jgi:tRNA-dependent cyclodipeptide synthase
MKIESLINTTEIEINNRQWNPYLGISINNKTFTLEYISEFMNWAADRAKDRAAVLVVDIIQRINNEVFNRSKPMAAIEKTFKKADEIFQLCSEAYSSLPPEKKERIVIVEWPDIMHDETFRFNSRILNSAFEQNLRFKEVLIAITRRNLGEITARLDEQQIESLSRYLLYELPEIFAGFHYDGIYFNLNVYPGKISSIYTELFEQECFIPIYDQLHIPGKIAMIEAYN